MMESSALDRVLSVERRLFPTEAPWTFYYGTAGFRDRCISYSLKLLSNPAN